MGLLDWFTAETMLQFCCLLKKRSLLLGTEGKWCSKPWKLPLKNMHECSSQELWERSGSSEAKTLL